jgi:hypothetical protein
MQEKARIAKIDGDVVSVVPLDIEACIGCSNAECKKNGSLFQAVNRKKYALSVGDEVRISAPAGKQLVQALVSVGLPVLLAVAVYAVFGVVAPGAGEGVRIAASLAALVAGMALVYATRRRGSKDLPEVVELL